MNDNDSTPDDLDYVDWVQRVAHQAAAGNHAERMLGFILRVREDSIPRRDLELLLAEVQQIKAGNGRVAADARPHHRNCDCPPEFPNIRDWRCVAGGEK